MGSFWQIKPQGQGVEDIPVSVWACCNVLCYTPFSSPLLSSLSLAPSLSPLRMNRIKEKKRARSIHSWGPNICRPPKVAHWDNAWITLRVVRVHVFKIRNKIITKKEVIIPYTLGTMARWVDGSIGSPEESDCNVVAIWWKAPGIVLIVWYEREKDARRKWVFGRVDKGTRRKGYTHRHLVIWMIMYTHACMHSMGAHMSGPRWHASCNISRRKKKRKREVSTHTPHRPHHDLRHSFMSLCVSVCKCTLRDMPCSWVGGCMCEWASVWLFMYVVRMSVSVRVVLYFCSGWRWSGRVDGWGDRIGGSTVLVVVLCCCGRTRVENGDERMNGWTEERIVCYLLMFYQSPCLSLSLSLSLPVVPLCPEKERNQTKTTGSEIPFLSCPVLSFVLCVRVDKSIWEGKHGCSWLVEEESK